MTSRARRDELPGRRDDGGDDDAGEAGCLGFVAGLPVVWIAMAGGAAMDPPWVLGLGLPLVYLVLAARPIRALPAKRRLAWALLPVGIVAGFPWGYGLFLIFIAPVSAVWLCVWNRRRAFGRRAPPRSGEPVMGEGDGDGRGRHQDGEG